MVHKRRRTADEVEALAAELRQRWKPDDGMEAWARENVVRLTRLVQSKGWAWDDIAKAATLAGVVYATGNPWTGAGLRVKMGQARRQIDIKRRLAKVPGSFMGEPAQPLPGDVAPAVVNISKPQPERAVSPPPTPVNQPAPQPRLVPPPAPPLRDESRPLMPDPWKNDR